MFIVGNAVIDDAVVTSDFCCDLKQCKGACCCIEGGRGAPLEDHEVLEVEKAYLAVKQYLSPESIRVIEQQGLYEGEPGHLATTCIGDRECVFAFFEDGIAQCSFERAYRAGQIVWQKPLSCHLFPLRIRSFGHDHVRYEQISECQAGRTSGTEHQTGLVEFLQNPLVRKYGEQWYSQLTSFDKSERVGNPPV